jgi:hypothetical protein
MYVRYPLSLRNVEDLLAERGIDISHETVWFWWNRFGRRCQGNAGFAHEAKRRLSSGDLRRKGAPLRQRGRASLLVDLPRDEMALLIELVVDLGVN